MLLNIVEVPIARSMIELAQNFPAGSPQVLSKYACLWIAFNNIYVTLAERAGLAPRLKTNDDGSLRTRQIGNVRVPEVSTVRERDQLEIAYEMFPFPLKTALVQHESTRFFAYRSPRWHNQRIERDAAGQLLNGVINVGYTQDLNNPIWAPIDLAMYERYLNGESEEGVTSELCRQVMGILYTVRNNKFHGGKRADDANDVEVVDKAAPLLEIVVRGLLREH